MCASFATSPGELVAEDVGSANGMFLDGSKGRHERIVIDGERPIRIGHTYLRIRETSHAVERERVARPGCGSCRSRSSRRSAL